MEYCHNSNLNSVFYEACYYIPRNRSEYLRETLRQNKRKSKLCAISVLTFYPSVYLLLKT